MACFSFIELTIVSSVGAGPQILVPWHTQASAGIIIWVRHIDMSLFSIKECSTMICRLRCSQNEDAALLSLVLQITPWDATDRDTWLRIVVGRTDWTRNVFKDETPLRFFSYSHRVAAVTSSAKFWHHYCEAEHLKLQLHGEHWKLQFVIIHSCLFVFMDFKCNAYSRCMKLRPPQNTIYSTSRYAAVGFM